MININGGISKELSQEFNLKLILRHENEHRLSAKFTSFLVHALVFKNDATSSNFSSASSDFQEKITTRYAERILNYYNSIYFAPNSQTSIIDELASFSSLNQGGFSLSQIDNSGSELNIGVEIRKNGILLKTIAYEEKILVNPNN